jgi:UPF0716 protein FxsA
MRLLIVFFILLGFPALEIFVLFRLADAIGWWLLPWLILSAVAGWTLIQEERMAVFGRLFSSLQSGQPLGYAMLDSLRTLFAGVLLIFPGVISDALAVLLLLLPRPKVSRPPVRESSDEVIIEGEWQREEDKRLK